MNFGYQLHGYGWAAFFSRSIQSTELYSKVLASTVPERIGLCLRSTAGFSELNIPSSASVGAQTTLSTKVVRQPNRNDIVYEEAPQGSVRFIDTSDGNTICSGIINQSGDVTCTFEPASVKTYQVQAIYDGDTKYLSAISPISQLVASRPAYPTQIRVERSEDVGNQSTNWNGVRQRLYVKVSLTNASTDQPLNAKFTTWDESGVRVLCVGFVNEQGNGSCDIDVTGFRTTFPKIRLLYEGNAVLQGSSYIHTLDIARPYVVSIYQPNENPICTLRINQYVEFLECDETPPMYIQCQGDGCWQVRIAYNRAIYTQNTTGFKFGTPPESNPTWCPQSITDFSVGVLAADESISAWKTIQYQGISPSAITYFHGGIAHTEFPIIRSVLQKDD